MNWHIRLIAGVLVAVGTMFVSIAPTSASDRPQITTQRSDHKVHRVKRRTKPKPKWMCFLATSYSPYEPGQGTITASGRHVVQGKTVATDPSVIPLGSTIEVKFASGLTHIYRAEDVGGSIIGKHIDIFNWSHQAALNFGRQYIKVHILHYGW